MKFDSFEFSIDIVGSEVICELVIMFVVLAFTCCGILLILV